MKQKLLAILLLGCLAITSAFAQNKTITGKVIGADDGLPLPGVSVKVKGTQIGAQTGSDGTYTIGIPADAKVLVFTYIGYTTKETTVGHNSVINIQLVSDAKQLGEVVIVGYGEQSRKLSTQSVSTVSAESFKNTPLTSPQQLLQGQAAGVQMTNSSGLLGAASSIKIRGVASIQAGGQPLFVIDGVPLNDGGYSQAQGGGTGLNPLLNINASDIESMTVLKDAAAVAIYGSRGSNGVVLVKTKSGSFNQKTQINLDYFTGFSNPTNKLKYMNGDEWRTLKNDYRVARGLVPNNYPTDNFDWVKAVTRTGHNNNYNLSARGGNEKTRFFLGGGYSDEKAFTLGNDMKRLSGRINLDHSVNQNIKVGVNYNLSNVDMNRVGAENNTAAAWSAAYLQAPFVTPYDAAGNFKNTGSIGNVIAQAALNTNKFSMQRSTGNAYAEIRFLKDFKIKTDWGIDNVQTDAKVRQAELLRPTGYGYRQVIADNKWVSTNTLNYNKEIGAHSFGALIGYSFETSRRDDILVEGTGFASDALPNVGSASTPTSTSALGSKWALESQFARVNYKYKDKYLFEATGRRDGSSRFGQNKKYGLFYALSGGWVLSAEDFLKDSKVVNFLKLTSSYGTSGNDRLGNYPYQELYGGGSDADYAGNPGLIPTQVYNPNLSWEESAQFDVTVNASLFNVLDIEASFYNKKTTGLLASQPFPYTTGFPSSIRNVGSMRNRGVDLMLTSHNFKRKDFEWTTSLNIGFVKNTVLSLPENRDDEGRNFLQGSTDQRAIVGESANTFYMVRYKGINPQTGNAEWYKKDGTVTTQYSSGDRVDVGSALPKFTGGFTNNFKYKDFDLSVFFNFSQGNKVLFTDLQFTENITSGFNNSTDLLNYWKNPGDNAFAPALSSPTNANFAKSSTLQLMNGSYLRLKTITLGYSIPKSVLSRSKVISSARFYVLAQNLWTIKDKNFRGADPEISANGASNQVVGETFFAVPQPRTITFGVNLGF